MSNSFGDFELEDAWDASDDKETHLENLRGRLLALLAVIAARLTIEELYEHAGSINNRRDSLSDLEREHLDELLADIETTNNQ